MKKWKKSIAAMLAAIVFVGGMPADKVYAEDATEVMENVEDTESTEAEEVGEAEGVVEDTESAAEESTEVVASESEDEATTGAMDEGDEDVSLNSYGAIQTSTNGLYQYRYYTQESSTEGATGYYLYRYLGNDAEVTVPSEIDGHTIVGIDGRCFRNNMNITKLIIPKTVTEIPTATKALAYLDPFGGCTNLESITVEEGNPVLWDDNGVLCSTYSAGNFLLKYPEGKKNLCYTIPYNVNKVNFIVNTAYLEKLIIPNTVDIVISEAFTNFTGTLYINETNASSSLFENITSSVFQGMGSDAKIVVKTDEIKNVIEKKLNRNRVDAYGNTTYYPPIEVNPNANPANSLTFSDGTAEKDVVVDVSNITNVDNTTSTYIIKECRDVKFDSQSATDNVTWVSAQDSMGDCDYRMIAKMDNSTGHAMGQIKLNVNNAYFHTGKVKLTGSDESGHNVTINLTVYQKVTSAELSRGDRTVEFDKNNSYVKVGYRVSPLNANNRSNEITWESSNPSVATVAASGGDEYNNYYSNFGTITLKSTGTTTITASINDKVNGKDNIISKSFTLTVKNPPVDINTLNISDIPDATYTGKAIKPAVTIKDGTKTLREGVDYTVNPTPGYNNIDKYGIPAKEGGITYLGSAITITGIGDYTGETTKEFVIKPYNLKKASVKLGDKDENGCYSKDDIVVTANGRELTVGKDYKVSLSSVSKDGYADIIVKGTNNYCGTYTIKKVKVSTGKANLSNATISGVKNVTYTGKAITFPVTIKLDGKVLDQNTDCTITYKNNKYAGTATIIVKAKSGSEYEGSCSKTFKIARKAQKIKNVKSSYTKKYGDKSFKIKPSVSDKAKVSYKSSNTKVVTVSKKGVIKPVNTGVAYVTVSTKATSGYSAAKKQIKITVKPKTQAVSSLKSRKKTEMTVTWKKDTKATGYQIQYSTNSKMKSAKTVRIKKNTTYKQTIKKLKKGKKYYVRVRSYKTVKVNGKSVTVYGSWSKVKSVKVRK